MKRKIVKEVSKNGEKSSFKALRIESLAADAGGGTESISWTGDDKMIGYDSAVLCPVSPRVIMASQDSFLRTVRRLTGREKKEDDKPKEDEEDDEDDEDDDDNGSGGGGGDKNNKKGSDRHGDGNEDKDKNGHNDGGGEMEGKNMNFKGKAMFGCRYKWHAGNEKGYPIGQLQCVQEVQ